MCFFPVQFSKICASLLPSVLDDIIIFILHCQCVFNTKIQRISKKFHLDFQLFSDHQ